MTWKANYDNDTGPGDEGFWEWWDVTNGDYNFRCFSEMEADWLVSILNSFAPHRTP